MFWGDGFAIEINIYSLDFKISFLFTRRCLVCCALPFGLYSSLILRAIKLKDNMLISLYSFLNLLRNLYSI